MNTISFHEVQGVQVDKFTENDCIIYVAEWRLHLKNKFDKHKTHYSLHFALLYLVCTMNINLGKIVETFI